jgi:hypothetical protein
MCYLTAFVAVWLGGAYKPIIAGVDPASHHPRKMPSCEEDGPRIKPIGAKIRCDVSRMRCSASDSEAVHRWSGTVAKAVCVTVPGLQRIIPLRSMLRSARDTRLS